jgi:NAD(P)-dependent dehydrogenase (short-subunit alcohol dehydrogenase family)
MASRIVAIAGGTGKLGRAIVERIVASDNFKVFVLAREVRLQLKVPRPR